MGGWVLKFAITIITWWVCVTKMWNCPLLFVTNLWCLQFFCKNVTSQLLKQEKRVAFFFQPKAIAKGLLILDNCETKKCFIVLHNNIVVLTKRKETSDLVCLFFASFILELWKKQHKKALFLFPKASVLCFVFGYRPSLP